MSALFSLPVPSYFGHKHNMLLFSVYLQKCYTFLLPVFILFFSASDSYKAVNFNVKSGVNYNSFSLFWDVMSYKQKVWLQDVHIKVEQFQVALQWHNTNCCHDLVVVRTRAGSQFRSWIQVSPQIVFSITFHLIQLWQCYLDAILLCHLWKHPVPSSKCLQMVEVSPRQAGRLHTAPCDRGGNTSICFSHL